MIPVVAAALPYAVPLLIKLVKQAQEHFGHNNGTGEVKLQTVAESAAPYLTRLATAGKIGALEMPQILSMAEMVVQMLKAAGILPGTEGVTVPVPALQPPALPLPQGQLTPGRRYTFQLIAVEG